ncbi:hypothetical protein, partial [Streptomyces mirabilis]|uniref:hypothetical protein n=1 Tax=Streptomyces mirabilis TaxID=68239 RepID=UPI00368CE5A4
PLFLPLAIMEQQPIRGAWFFQVTIAPNEMTSKSVEGPTLWVLAMIGFITVVCVMGAKLASDFETLAEAWIGVLQRLRELLRRRR